MLRRRRRRGYPAERSEELLAEINITPLTDVLLVLLIIFLIASAAGVFGFNMRLPQGPPKKLIPNQFEGIMLTIPSWAGKKHAIFVGGRLVNLDILPRYLSEERLRKKSAEVVLRVDRTVAYGIVIQVIDSAKTAHLDPISFAAPVAR